MADEQTPIPTPVAQRLEDVRRRYVPLVVWVVCAVVVAAMLFGRAGRFEYVGVARALEYQISADADARVDTLVVGLFDTVRAGDVVAKLDDRRLRAEIETSNARLAQLRTELEAARAELVANAGRERADRASDLRRFQINEEQRRLDLLELQSVIQSDEIELERLRLELQRAEPLLDAGLISELERDNLELLHRQASERVAENRVLRAQLEQELATATARRERFERQATGTPEQDALLAPLRAAIDVESRRLDEIEVDRQATVLRSPVDGQVTAIFARTGQSVRPGDPILSVAESSVREIVAYLDESDSTPVAPQTRVMIASRSRPQAAAESVVVNVGPGVQAKPERLWRDPRVPDYGRAVVIAAAPGLGLVPGELVEVRFLGDAATAGSERGR